jgi:hypothetical protein
LEPPSLKLTPEAKNELLVMLGNSNLQSPIIALGWTTAASSMWLDEGGEEHFESFGPAWEVGFFEASRIPPNEVHFIEGLPFCFGQPKSITDRLNGATLHYRNGAFTVAENAI